MKPKTAFLFSSLLMLSVNVCAHERFESYTWFDEDTNQEVFSRFSHNGSIPREDFASFSIQCSIAEGDLSGEVRLFLTDLKGIGVPFADVRIHMSIDNKYRYQFKGEMSKNSFLSAYVMNVPSNFFNHLKTGENILVKSYSSNKLQSRNEFSLSGSSDAIRFIEEKCGVSLSDSYEVTRKKEMIRKKYHRKIESLRRQMEQEISKI